ncbi:hypothetical protein FOE78_16805 [Microlunatus elymi]|uniref:Secreted protein n=1 Tax=Microlunatus elymi TaxID=2596828 RepID=A0A516Q1P4_9ACTN|nr:hypothetical protein [Microlunatus elymi]QDP97359.1 hypothetical protein FOE78_16805 [Microlunatus elymi]
MNTKLKVATMTAAAGLAIGGLLAGSAPADAAQPQRAATAEPMWFGQSASVDGYQIWATVQHGGREHSQDAHPGRLSETVTVYVTQTAHHQKWKGHWNESASYGKHLTHKATNDDGEGFMAPTEKFPTVMSWTRFGVGKNQYPKHFEYTFVFKGHKLHWATS